MAAIVIKHYAKSDRGVDPPYEYCFGRDDYTEHVPGIGDEVVLSDKVLRRVDGRRYATEDGVRTVSLFLETVHFGRSM